MKTLALWLALSSLLAGQEAIKLARQQLLEDARQLATILESSHPDPYIQGGGRIAFHRRLSQVYRSIPEDGMTVEAFHRLLQPLTAALRDGHTRLYSPGASGAPGLPFSWEVLEDGLFVRAVYGEQPQSLLGARLSRLQGLEWPELQRRSQACLGSENIIGDWVRLAYGLEQRSFLRLLLPEWDGSRPLTLELKDAQGHLQTLCLTCPQKRGEKHEPAPRTQLPRVNEAGLGFGWLDGKRQIGLLRIEHCQAYREGFEAIFQMSPELGRDYRKKLYTRIHGKPAPADDKAMIRGLISATGFFQEMMRRLKAAKTETLLIDLRSNPGGSSNIRNILAYCLYGPESIQAMAGTYAITRKSELFFQQYPTAVGMAENTDYDFSGERAYQALRQKKPSLSRDDLRKAWEEEFSYSPTFLKALRQKRHPYRPSRIRVLINAETFSAGFDVASMLERLGAELVGTASAQAANCFGDSLDFRLKNSQLSGTVSHKLFIEYPDDPAKGKLLRPKRHLIYEDFKRHGFAPDTAVLVGMQLDMK